MSEWPDEAAIVAACESQSLRVFNESTRGWMARALGAASEASPVIPVRVLRAFIDERWGGDSATFATGGHVIETLEALLKESERPQSP